MTPEQQSLSSIPASPSSASLDASSRLLAESHSSDSEHTLGGKLIGAIREHTFGKGSAQSNDQIATIAADTVASLPIVKSWVGGLVRASILVDPTKGLSGNATGFGLNFAEGFALNKVSSLYNPESSLSRFATAKLGTGIAAEGATHLAVGFGFGAVRAGFSEQTWLDKQGNFSLASGGLNVLKDGGIGAAFNLPAGLIGTRIAKASSLALANDAISPRLANSLAGAGSGYAAGGVFGGLGAVMSGKSLVDVLKSANEGGVIGAVTGFGMGGLQSPARLGDAAPAPKPASYPGEAAQLSLEPRLAGSSPVVDGRLLEQQVAKGKGDVSLEIQPRDYRLSEVTPRLRYINNTEETTHVMPQSVEGPWDNWEAYSKSATPKTVDFRNYKIEGHSAILSVPESYAKQLDNVRLLRTEIEKPNVVLDGLTPVMRAKVQHWYENGNQKELDNVFSPQEWRDARPIISARHVLAKNLMSNRALPEDLITLLDELPIRSNIKRLTLLDDEFWANKWHEQEYKKGFKADASADSTNGSVEFYKALRIGPTSKQYRDQLRHMLMHEDTHLTTSDNGLYETASPLEKDHHVSDYSKRNVREREAEDRSVGFLNPDGDHFHDFVDNAPIRAAVIARDLAIQMNKDPSEQGIYAKEYWARINHVQDKILPKAQEKLVRYLRNGDAEEAAAAVKLMSFLGNSDHAPELMSAAHRHADGNEDKLSMAAFDAALKVTESEPEAQFKLVWNEAQPNGPFTDNAIMRMRYLGTVHENAAPAARLLEMVRDKDFFGVAKQIKLMRSDETKLAAYNYAVELGAGRPEFLRSLATRMLREQPTLRAPALKTLASQEDSDGLELLVKRYVSDPDPDVSRTAREIHASAVTKSANDLIAQGEYPDHFMVRELGRLEGSGAMPALIKTAMNGPESSATAALEALSRHTPNFVGFYIKQLKMTAAPPEVLRLSAFQAHIPGRVEYGLPAQ